jgi:hypothetical protein
MTEDFYRVLTRILGAARGAPDLERHGWCNRLPLNEVLHHERYTPR